MKPLGAVLGVLVWLAPSLLPCALAQQRDQAGEPLPQGAVARLGSARLRHGSEVTALTFTPDGKGLLAGDKDGALVLWDLAIGKECRRLLDQGPPITAVAFSPDGKWLIAGRSGGPGFKFIQVWDAATGECVDSLPFNHDFGVQRLVFFPDGRSLLSFDGNVHSQEIECREIPGGRWRSESAKLEKHVQATVFAPNGRALAVQYPRHLELLELPSREERAHIDFAEDESPRALAFAENGKKLFCLDQKSKLLVLDSRTGKVLERLDALMPEGLPTFAVTSLAGDGKTLAFGHGNRIGLWDLRTGKPRLPAGCRLHPLLAFDTPVQTSARAQFSPDGRLLTVFAGGEFTVADGASGRLLWQMPEEGTILQANFFSRGRQLILAEVNRDGCTTLSFREAATGKKRRSLPLPGTPWLLAASADGRWLAGVLADDPCVYLWDEIRQRSARLRGNGTRSVLALIFSPDSRSLITAGADGYLRVWDVATGREIKSWSGHGGHGILALAFAANGKVLASAGLDGMIRLWQTGTWELLRRIDHQVPRPPESAFVALSPDGQLVLSVNRDGTVLGWKTETGRPALQLLGRPAAIKDACFSPDGKRLVTVGADDTALVWDLAATPTVKEPAEAARKSGALARLGSKSPRWGGFGSRSAVLFSPQGRSLAICGELWDPVSGRLLRRCSPDSTDLDRFQAFSPDGSLLALVGSDGVACFRTQTGECLTRIAARSITALAFSPDGRMLALGKQESALEAFARQDPLGTSEDSEAPSILLWDLREEKLIARLPANVRQIDQLVFSTDGRLLHAVGSRLKKRLEECTCRQVWDVAQRKCLAQFEGEYPILIALSPAGRFLAQSKEKQVEILDPVSNRKLRALAGEADSLVFSANEKLLAVATASAIELWDPADGKRLRSLSDPTVPRQQVLSFSGAGRWLVTLDNDEHTRSTGMIRVWNVPAGKLHRPTVGPIGAVQDLAWLPDGELVALEQGGSVTRLTDTSGKELLRLSDRQQRDLSLAVNSTGRLVALQSEDDTVEVWDLRQGQRKTRWPGNRPAGELEWSRQGQVRFAADGDRVLSLTWEGTLKSWSLGTGQPLRSWEGSSENALALSPDGRQLVVVQRSREEGIPFHRLRVICPWTGKEYGSFQPIPCNSVAGCAFSNDGRLLAVVWTFGLRTRIRVIEIATGQEIVSLPGWGSTLTFSPDDRYLVADGNAIHDLVLGRELGVLPGEQDRILSVAFSPDGRKLATGSSDHRILIWDATWPTLPRPSWPKTPPVAAEVLWRQLARPEAEPAWRAVWRLALAPEQSLPLLQRKLQPAPALDAAKLARWLPELEHDDFARREVARKEILTLGEGALPALRRRLEAKPAADLKRLLEGLLEDLEPKPNAPQCLLDSRAIAVLERIGTTEARRLLRTLASGAEGHSRTEMGRAALRRLERRASP